MSISSKIKDGCGKDRSACVTENRALKVAPIVDDLPEGNTQNRVRFYTSEITNMDVDGSGTPQKFTLTADNDTDIIISQVAIMLADNAITMNKFGNIASLANGWTLNVHEGGVVTPIIEDAVSNSDILLKSGNRNNFGGSAMTINEIGNWSGSSDAFICFIDFSHIPSIAGVPGIRLGRGTHDKFESVINDNVKGLNEFILRFFGSRHVS